MFPLRGSWNSHQPWLQWAFLCVYPIYYRWSHGSPVVLLGGIVFPLFFLTDWRIRHFCSTARSVILPILHNILVRILQSPLGAGMYLAFISSPFSCYLKTVNDSLKLRPTSATSCVAKKCYSRIFRAECRTASPLRSIR